MFLQLNRCHGEENNVVYELAKDTGLLSSNMPRYLRFNFFRSNGEEIPKKTADRLSEIAFQIIEGFEDEKNQYNGSLGNFFAEK